jgi:FkbM family methyltransferase
MAGYTSPLRSFLKPLLFKLAGPGFYKRLQAKAMIKNLDERRADEPELELLPQLIKPGESAIDVGANYLYITMLLARLTGKGAVHALEPVPFTYEVGEMILKHYKPGNVTLHKKGASNENKSAVFNLPLQDFGAISAGQAHIGGRDNEVVKDKAQYPYIFQKHNQVTCELVRLDDYLKDVANLGFVKIDIEGAEVFALEGMQALLREHKPIILLEIVEAFLEGFGKSGKDIELLLGAMGYQLYHYNASTKQLTPAQSPFPESNFLAVPIEKMERIAALIKQ